MMRFPVCYFVLLQVLEYSLKYLNKITPLSTLFGRSDLKKIFFILCFVFDGVIFLRKWINFLFYISLVG